MKKEKLQTALEEGGDRVEAPGMIGVSSTLSRDQSNPWAVMNSTQGTVTCVVWGVCGQLSLLLPLLGPSAEMNGKHSQTSSWCQHASAKEQQFRTRALWPAELGVSWGTMNSLTEGSNPLLCLQKIRENLHSPLLGH